MLGVSRLWLESFVGFCCAFEGLCVQSVKRRLPFEVSRSVGEKKPLAFRMANSSPRFRLVADPSLGVSDLEACLTDFVKEYPESNNNKSLNFGEFLKLPPGMSWKSAANPAYLAKLSPLLCKYAKIAPNGVLPSKKHKIALESVDKSSGLQKSEKRSQSDFIDFCDDAIRMALSHYRALKNDVAKARLFRKADMSQQRSMEEVLSLLTGVSAEAEPVEAFEGTAQPLALVGRLGSSSSLDVEEVVTPGARRLMAEQSSLSSGHQQASASSGGLDPAQVFMSVLQKPGLEDSPDGPVVDEKVMTPEKKRPQAGNPSEGSPKLFLKGLLAIQDLDPEDRNVVAGLKDYKADLQKPPPKPKSKNKKPVAKAKAQAKGAAKKTAAKPKKDKIAKLAVEPEQEEQEEQEEQDDKEMDAPGKGAAAVAETANVAEVRSLLVAKSGRRGRPESELTWSERLNRFASRAYHQARDQAEAKGLSLAECKAAGSKASIKAREEFRQKFPKAEGSQMKKAKKDDDA